MIRLIQRRLIVPRGDTGTFTIPVLAGKDTGDVSIFTVFDPLMHRKIFEKVMTISGETLTMELTHGDTVNLPVGQYVWDIKFYTDPIFAEEKLIGGTEVDSYYAAFTLPVCEIRETGDNLLMSDDAPTGALKPGQIDFVTASINEMTSLKNTTTIRAAEADTSAQNAANSAQDASVSAQEALDSQAAALVSQQAAQTAAENAQASATLASQKAAEIGTNLENKANIADLDDVAFSGDYNDLSNKPTIPDIQINGSSIINNGVANIPIASKNNNGVIKVTNANVNEAISNGGSVLINDELYYVGSSALYAFQYGNDQGALVSTAYQHWSTFYGLAKAAGVTGAGGTVGTYTSAAKTAIQTMLDVPAKADIPTNVSQLTNDAGYLTQHQDISGKANSADLATVATSGSYNDLLNKPTNVSAFTNDAGYLTSFTETDPTVPAWAKTPTKPAYTAAEVGAPTVQEMNSAISTAIGSVNSFDMAVVQELPTQDISTHTIYLVPKTGETNDVYNEYVYINNAWEMVGNTQIDLSNYVQKTDIATSSNLGIVRPGSGLAITIDGKLTTNPPPDSVIKTGTSQYAPITVGIQDKAIFYGLAKAAGDTTQAQSNNAIGTYTDEAKTAIQSMLNVPDVASMPFEYGTSSGSIQVKPWIGYGQLYSSIANGAGAFAIGNSTAALGMGSFSQGSSTHAIGTYSYTQGSYVNAFGDYSYATGNGTRNTVFTITDTNNDKEYILSTSLSVNNDTLLPYIHGVITVDNILFAIIRQVEVMDDRVFKITLSQTIGQGYDNDRCTIYFAFTNGEASYTAGNNLIADSNYQFIQGKNNVIDSNNLYAHIVGNGTSVITRSNAYALTWTGDGKYAGDIYVHANADSSGGTKLAKITDIPDVPVQDVQVNGVSLLNNGIANIPVANSSGGRGLVSAPGNGGISSDDMGVLMIVRATAQQIKAGTYTLAPIVPKVQHNATFYGLAKAAGDSTQAASDNAVGVYTAEAKIAIQNMLDVPSKSDLTNLIAISNNAPQGGDAKIWIDTDDSTTVQVPTVAEMNLALAAKADAEDIPEVPVQDIQVNDNSILNNGIASLKTVAVSGNYNDLDNRLWIPGSGTRSISTVQNQLTYSATGFKVSAEPNSTILNIQVSRETYEPLIEALIPDVYIQIPSISNIQVKVISIDRINKTITIDKALSSSIINNQDITIVMNESIVTGTSAVNLGIGNKVTGLSAYVNGILTAAIGQSTVAFGSANLASNSSSFVCGQLNEASGSTSFCSGFFNRATGQYSTAQGFRNIVSGGKGHVEGQDNQVTGVIAHAEGAYNIANSRSQHVSGEYNFVDLNNDSTVRGTYVEIIGNGTNQKRSNAYTLEWTGTAHYAGDVYVGCNNDSTGGTRLATITEVAAKLDATEAGLKVVRLI